MFKENYKKELDNITLSDDFKKATVQLLLEKSRSNSPAPATEAKTIRFPKKAVRNIAAACFAVLIAFYGSGYFIKSEESIGFDSANPESENQSAEIINGIFDPGTDSAAAMNKKTEVYSVADSIPLQPHTFINDDGGGTGERKLYAFMRVGDGGGMGFESYLMYNSSQLEQNSAYSVNDEFDTLPVYFCARLLEDTGYFTRLKDILDKMEVNYSGFEFLWYKYLYNEDGYKYSVKSLTTTEPVCPEEGYFLYMITADITNKNGVKGECALFAGRGQIRVSFEEELTITDTPQDVYGRAKEKYPGIFTPDSVFRTSYDYDIYGDINFSVYGYEKHRDYGVNIYNSTKNYTSISQILYRDNKDYTNKTFFWFELPEYWQQVGKYPAINYKEALGLMYDGKYYSSCPDEISQDTKVSHIELVYLGGYYNLETERYESYTLPFYKFYVDVSDNHNFGKDANLKTYAAYYVSALHPDYLKYWNGEEYVQFN